MKMKPIFTKSLINFHPLLIATLSLKYDESSENLIKKSKRLPEIPTNQPRNCIVISFIKPFKALMTQVPQVEGYMSLQVSINNPLGLAKSALAKFVGTKAKGVAMIPTRITARISFLFFVKKFGILNLYFVTKKMTDRRALTGQILNLRNLRVPVDHW